MNKQTNKIIQKQNKHLPTDQGQSYLEAKYQAMLTYCINIAFYLLLKARGISVKDHPVIKELVKVRTVLEKLKPLDMKLKHQIDLILNSADNTGVSTVTSAKPNINNLMNPSLLLSQVFER